MDSRVLWLLVFSVVPASLALAEDGKPRVTVAVSADPTLRSQIEATTRVRCSGAIRSRRRVTGSACFN